MFSKAKVKTKVRMEWETITPKQAQDVLDYTASSNFPQRPLSQSTAHRYAQEIKAGTWHSHTADVIRLCLHQGSYAVLDGQHRLKAIAKAGIPQTMWVAYDVPENAFKYVDQGSVRTLAHVMNAAGWPNASTLASTGRMLYCNHHGQAPIFNKGLGLASGTLFDWIAENHGDLAEIQEVYGKVIRKASKRCHVVESVVLFLFYNWEKLDHDEAVRFITFLADSYESEPSHKVYRFVLARLDENNSHFIAQKAQGVPIRTEMQRYQQGMALRFSWLCAQEKLANPTTVRGFNTKLNAFIKERLEKERSWEL